MAAERVMQVSRFRWMSGDALSDDKITLDYDLDYQALVILDAAPADLLRDHDAEVWDAAIQEARRVVQRRHGQPHETDIDLITLPNPYREKPGD